MSQLVAESSKVTFHFSLSLDDGEIIDSTFDKSPATLTVGDGSLLPGYEACLLGLKAGEKTSFLVGPDKGFGQHNPDNVQHFKRKDFEADIELAEGMIISFADASGAEVPGVVKSYDDKDVEVDFNHPLAGRDVTFRVEIIDVE